MTLFLNDKHTFRILLETHEKTMRKYHEKNIIKCISHYGFVFSS